MKYVVIQGDGMSDFPVPELGGLTPLEKAVTPHLDRIANDGRLGLARTIPAGMPSGTDVGTMSILGYDPERFHTGRSPIEAASMGIDLGEAGVAFRCNLVTLSGEGEERVMQDFTAGHIGSDEAAELLSAVGDALGGDGRRFHAGVSYRHLLVWEEGPDRAVTTPPHDITDQGVAPYLPHGAGGDAIERLMESAREVLAAHPVNRARRERGELPATDIWLWGQGRKPSVPTLDERYGIHGGLITAVDVVGGLGRMAGMDRIDVPGITGFIDTNYEGKASYALDALDSHDLVFIHVESTDETGHMGDAALKVCAIEDLDGRVIGPVLEGLGRFDAWRVLALPDHATPVSTKTHADDPVPFAILDAGDFASGLARGYSERAAEATGDFVEQGHCLLGQFLGRAELARPEAMGSR